jgi:parallel beta-helix repeat protein
MNKAISLFIFITFIAMTFVSCDNEEPNPNAPTACFTAPTEIIAGISAEFSSACSENALSFAWDFGDGGTSTLANPSHTFTSEGSYTVTLTVTSSEGDTDQDSKSVNVAAPQAIEHSGYITSNETWVEGIHIITGDVYVDDCVLTILPGAVIKFNQGTGIYFGYHGATSGTTLIANGTSSKPITFTSSLAVKEAGDWDYIGFYGGTSSTSSMQYCVVEYGGGYGSDYGAIYLQATHINIDHCTVQYSRYLGISLNSDAWFGSFTGNTLKDIQLYPIGIHGNYAHTIGTGNTITTSKGVLVYGDYFEQASATWLNLGCPYILYGELYIQSETGAVLTIQPGAEIQISDGIYIGYSGFGTLIAEGNSQSRIKFTSNAPGGSKTAGDWGFIGFYEGAVPNSSFGYCDIEYGGGYSSYMGMINIDESSVSFTNCNISNSETYGITADYEGYFTACQNNNFENDPNGPIQVYANWANTIGTGNTFNNTGLGIVVLSDYVDKSDATWLKHGVPYVIMGEVYVENPTGAKLTIQAGTTLKFTEGAYLIMGYGGYGTLIAQGTNENKITFTSAAPAGFESPGDWDGLWFYDGTGPSTVLDYCNISYGGGYSTYSGNLIIDNTMAGVPAITNCNITYSESYGIYLDNASPTLSGNTMSNNALGDFNIK